MGDFRFHFEAKFSMGDVEDSCNMSLNYSEGEGSIDKRVFDWLSKCFEAGRDNIRSRLHEADVEARDREMAIEEDAILAQAEEIKKRRAASP